MAPSTDPGPAAELKGEGDAAARDAQALDAALYGVIDATRALLWLETPAEAAAAALDLIGALGGRVVEADTSASDTIPVDVSFGASTPLLPAAPPASVGRMLLEHHLPAFVRDAHRALELADNARRLAEEAGVDILTGLANRRLLGRTLGRLLPDQTVIMIDLDHFKNVNDSLGHHQGDQVLRTLGRTLTSSLRSTDRAGRYGGEEFVVVIQGNGAEPFLRRLHTAWLRTRPHPVTYSAGVAPAAPDPVHALEAADRAMYRAKREGRNRWCAALPEDYR